MATKSTRILDPQGRIMIPHHIRDALNLVPGNYVEMDLEEDGTIRLRFKEARCAICGESVESKYHTDLDRGATKKHICYECAQALAQEMIKKM